MLLVQVLCACSIMARTLCASGDAMLYTVDLTIARPTFQNIDIADAKMWILKADSSFDLLLNGTDIIPWPAGLTAEVDHCCVSQGTIGIRNNAGTGQLLIYSSSDYCLDLSGFAGLASVLASQASVIAEGTTSHSFIETSFTNPQEIISTKGDGGAYGVSAGGVAGQNFSTVIPYYGALTASVLASAVALNGGRVVFNVGRMQNLDIVINALQTTALTFTRSPQAVLEAGLWSFAHDALLETPTIGVGGHLIASMGLGLRIDVGTGANGVGGLRGCGICWSNGLSNNNYHLIAADGTNVTRDIDTGVPAFGHHQLDFRFGSIAGVPIIQAVIDGVSRAVATDIGMTMATISAMAAGVWLPAVSAGKMQLGQNGNQVSFRHAGYSGYRFGRVS